jgi:hypothetical protein
LARRDLCTARPARVLMRARNPCLRARRRLFGWYVRFTTISEGSTTSALAASRRDIWSRSRADSPRLGGARRNSQPPSRCGETNNSSVSYPQHRNRRIFPAQEGCSGRCSVRRRGVVASPFSRFTQGCPHHVDNGVDEHWTRPEH